MLMGKLSRAAAVLLTSASVVSASFIHSHASTHSRHVRREVYFPKPVADMKSFTSPSGVTIRYKEPGKAGVCETTEGVNSYSGYIDLAPNVHMFFWFFESRRDPANDDLTLWLNGGPGSDSLIGLLQELGPCRISPDLNDTLNPWSWNEVSNMLFLSQPVATGFSYADKANGSLTNYTGTFVKPGTPGYEQPTGTYPILDPLDEGQIDMTDLAAIAAWHTLQAFLEGLPSLEGNRAIAPKKFNLWTESYGGHYGPSFFNYFQEQNKKITDGSMPGYALNFNTLGLINAIIDEYTQVDSMYDFAVNNTYGIKGYNDTVYEWAKFASNWENGCKSQIAQCATAAADLVNTVGFPKVPISTLENPSVAYLCSSASAICRDTIEVPFYIYSGRGTYDIRHPDKDPLSSDSFADWLNTGRVQQALGVELNYTKSNNDINYAFARTGDFVYPNFAIDLAAIVDSGVRVGLFYGDADYICNWFGGELISEQLGIQNQAQFNASGYTPFMWNGTQYGETREYANYSFSRIYESGHEIPYYQPQAALAFFTRMLDGKDVATGEIDITANFSSKGDQDTHFTTTYPKPPASTDAAYAAYSASVLDYYYSIGQIPNPDAATPMPNIPATTTASGVGPGPAATTSA